LSHACRAKGMNKRVVMDDRIIFCDDPASSLEGAFLLMEYLMGPEMTQVVKHVMPYHALERFPQP
jgi:hypothetical protein